MVPLIGGALATLLFVLTLQRRLFGDGIYLLDQFRGGDLLYSHLLYLPLAELVRTTLGVGPETALKLISAGGGGLAVATTVAMGRIVCGSAAAGVLAGALLAVLPGFWFHSTASEVHAVHAGFASLLLLVLIAMTRRQSLDGILRPLGLAVASLLTPLSHLSGMATLLPSLYAARAIERGRARALLSIGVGTALFAVAYMTAFQMGDRVHRYGTGFADLFAGISITDAPRLVVHGLHELLIPAVPAAVLVPTGLRILYRRSRLLATLLLLWMVAWCLPCFPIGDVNAHGSYFVPTFPAQAVLCVVALGHVRRHAGRIAVFAVLPGIASIVPYLALPAYAVCAWLVWRQTDSDATPFRIRTAAPILFLAFAWTAISVLAGTRDDAVRDRIETLAPMIRDRASVVMLFERSGFEFRLWDLGFQSLPELDSRQLRNIYPLELLALEQAEVHMTRVRARVRRAIDQGHEAWFVGPREVAEEGRTIPALLNDIKATYNTEEAEGFEKDVVVIRAWGISANR